MNNYSRKKTNKYGDTCYYNDKGQLHRLDGPAVEEVGRGKFWYVDGKLHRADGPAIEYADDRKSWYVNGKKMTKEEFNKHPLVVEKVLGKIIGEVLDE